MRERDTILKQLSILSEIVKLCRNEVARLKSVVTNEPVKLQNSAKED